MQSALGQLPQQLKGDFTTSTKMLSLTALRFVQGSCAHLIYSQVE